MSCSLGLLVVPKNAKLCGTAAPRAATRSARRCDGQTIRTVRTCSNVRTVDHVAICAAAALRVAAAAPGAEHCTADRLNGTFTSP